MNRISYQLVPPGGWKYQQENHWLEAATWNDLVKIVAQHRQNNGIPIGDVVEDIEEQLLDANPSLSINGPYLKKKIMGVSFFHTVQSFAQFLWNWTLSGGQLVDQNTANIRAEVCVQCHNNKPSSEVKRGCSVCNKGGTFALDKIRDSIIKGNKTASNAKLMTCGICGCDLKIKVWIPNAVLLKSEEANAYPEFCWNKKILQGQDL